MKRQLMSAGMSMVIALSSVASGFAIDETTFNSIKGNSVVVGDYLFDLNTNESDFTLDNFMKATRTITGQYNNIFYKNLQGSWYELVGDQNMVDGITQATALKYMPNSFATIYGNLDANSGSGNENNGNNENGQDLGKILNIEQSQIVNIEQVHYGVLVLKNGNADDYNFTIGGQSFVPSSVSDNKKIVKFEVNPNEKAVVVVTSKLDKTMTEQISLGTGTDEFSGLIDKQAPEKVLANGAISVFDYYLDNYDRLGNVRSQALKTTFNTEDEGFVKPNDSLPTLSADKTLLGQDVKLKVSGNNVEQWLGNVYKVQKDYGTGWGSRVDVAFTVTDDGIKILANSTATADRNGKHDIVVLSNGFEEVRVTIELVEPAGKINLTGEFNWWANQDLLFELTDFNYAITNPIYQVELDGIVLKGDCDEYHVISNLVRLENNVLPLLTVGKHTLIVRAEGFEDYKITFTLEKALNGQQNPNSGDDEATANEIKTVSKVAPRALADGVSRATSGGSSDGSGGSGSGSLVINGYLIFDFDLMANARILTHLGMDTAYAKEVLSWWGAMAKDALFYADGSYKLVDYTYFKNNGGMSSGNDNYVTFKELYDKVTPYTGNMFDKQHPGLALNRPSSVKNVMEDGLLGTVTPFYETSAADSPTLTVTPSHYGEDIVLNYEGTELEAWLDKITLITLNTNSYVTNYSIDKEAKTIRIPSSNAIVAGTNYIAINAVGYKTAKVSVSVLKHNASELKANVNQDGSTVISGMEVSYINAMTNIKVNGMTLFNDSQYGSGKGHYEVVGNTIVLRASAFENSGEQVLTIYASGYENSVLRFNNNSITEGETPKSDVPQIVELDSTNSYSVNKAVKIITGTMLDTAYAGKITEVTVNNKAVKNQYDGIWNGTSFDIDGSEFDNAGEYTIAIMATGFKDKVFNITISGDQIEVPSHVVAKSKSVTFGKSIEIVLADYNTNNEYYNELTGVTIDGESKQRDELSISNSFTSLLTIPNLAIGKHEIVLHAKGHKDKTFNVEVVGSSVPSLVKVAVNEAVTSSTSITATKEDKIQIIVGDAYSTSYSNALTKYMVNGNAVEDITLDSLKVSSGFMSDDFKVITIPMSSLVDGDNEISIHASGYNVKEFTITISIQE